MYKTDKNSVFMEVMFYPRRKTINKHAGKFIIYWMVIMP